VEFGVMEYADSGDFSQLIDRKIKVSDDELKDILIGILDGLDYLHKPQPLHNKPSIIHRDLKASNILFVSMGDKLIPKICDFGISKEVNSSDTLTSTNTGALGTVEYMAPEQLNISKFGQVGRLQPNVDFWALGCMLYEYFTDKAPFGKRSDGIMAIDIQANILDNEPVYPNSIPAKYQKFIQRCLVKNAVNRVADANSLKRIVLDVDEVVGSKIKIDKPKVEPEKKSDDADTRLLLTFAYTLTFIAIIIVAIFLYFHKDSLFTPKETSIENNVTTDAEVVTEYMKYTNTSGETFDYNGALLNGSIPNGKGTAIYTNGDKYIGDFQNGLRNGTGIYYWSDGEKFEGEYKDNLRNGFGKYYSADGSLIEQGNYINGELK
jgi:serine/threonine protein kinase